MILIIFSRRKLLDGRLIFRPIVEPSTIRSVPTLNQQAELILVHPVNTIDKTLRSNTENKTLGVDGSNA